MVEADVCEDVHDPRLVEEAEEDEGETGPNPKALLEQARLAVDQWFAEFAPSLKDVEKRAELRQGRSQSKTAEGVRRRQLC